MIKYLVSITVLATLLATVQAQLKGYPPVDKVPDVKSAEVKAWLEEIDLSGAPKIPIAKASPGDPPKCNNKQLPNECHWTCFDCAADDITFCPRANTWGLTFDDGPTDATPALLDYLKSKRLNASFFLIGSNVVALPQHVQREVAEGHHLASHTWSHTALTTLTNEQIVAEMKWTEKAVLEATGLRLKYMRPPYGDINNRVRYVLKKLGYLVVDWTGDEFDTNDWNPNLSDSKKIALMTKSLDKYAAGKRTTGFYMLEHDQSSSTVRLAPKLLPLGMARNISFGNIPVCQGDSQPYQAVKGPTTTPTKATATTTAVTTTVVTTTQAVTTTTSAITAVPTTKSADSTANTTTTTRSTTRSTTATPQPTSFCVAGVSGKKNGKGKPGQCCKTSADCIESCKNGVCGTCGVHFTC